MDSFDDSMGLRRSSRRSITLRSCSPPQSTTSCDVGSGVRLGKRVKSEGVRGKGGASSGGDNSSEARPAKSDIETQRSGKTKRRKTSESSRATRTFLYSTRMRRASGGGHRDRAKYAMEPVRRSTRQKRLVFATLNVSEMDKQILDPKHGYPDVDSSDEEMEPYEKLFSPKRVIRKSSRLREKQKDDQEDGKKVKEERVEGEEGKEDNEEDTEQEESEEEEEEEEEEGEEGEEDGDNSEEEQLEDEAEMTYNLRKRRPVIYQYQPVIQVVEDDTPPKKLRRRQGLRGRGQASYHTKARSAAPRAYQPRRQANHMRSGEGRKRHVQRHGDSSTTSSGSDSDEARFRRRKARSMAKGRAQCLPMNFAPEDLSHGATRDRVRIGASLADIDPMSVDRSVTFDSVGGLQHHVRALKEMIIFPLLYPEVFERFKINPPRGVLFYGPPGCGKTLVARALANECSKGGKKVAFFMRKGADCLSKWIGESERQLRLLFDQAYQLRPSIIFFDEIDGLAPVRSSRQDQIHSSIVSTLLALMDGLDSRGEVVVIGATNRIDAIDPALRRPGRFDREFLFPLPSREDRYSILTIHTRAWNPQLKPEFLSELADSSVGYCGADLRALCTEAALFALRRKYPQIYKTTDKLVLDVASINVSASDFHSALKIIVPTAQRSDASTACAIPEHVRPLLLSSFNSLLSLVSFVFPPCWKAVNRAAKEVKVLVKLEENLLKEMHTSLQNIEHDRNGSNSCASAVSLGLGLDNAADKRLKGPSNCSKGHIVSRSNKLKMEEVSGSQHRPSWSHRQQQQTQERGNTECSSDSRHYKASGYQKWVGSTAGNGLLAAGAGRRQPHGVANGESEREDEEEDVENDSSELFSRLYESSQASELDQFYFDLKDALTEEADDREGAGTSRSILIEKESQHLSTSPSNNPTAADKGNISLTQEQTQPSFGSSLFSQRYLTLSSHPHALPTVHRPRLILCGPAGMGQTSLLSPALLHVMEEFPVKTLDLTTVFATSTKTPEEACTQVFREARRVAPSIVYLPRINTWWEVTPETFRATLFSVVYSLPPTTPLLVLATAECPFGKLPSAVRELFKQDCSKVYTVQSPSIDERRRFFYHILMERPSLPPPPKPIPTTAVELEVLPVAPPPKPRELNEGEVEKIEKQREAVLRELRVFLRDATNKLLAERKFKEFAKPVDSEEVPDYYKIIHQPMDLGTIMKKIDEHRYTVPKQWREDVDLITKNALEYNPEHDSESRLLRHRAVALQDMAHSFLDHELSEDFEQQCNEIADTYKRLGKDPSLSSPLKKYPSLARGSHPPRDTHNKDVSSSIATAVSIKSELYDAPRRSLRQKGLVPEQSGIPYYSPTRLRRTPQDISKSADQAVGGGVEGAGEGKPTEGERTESETPGTQDVAVTEAVGGHPQRRTSVRSQRLRSRRSNTTESLETKMEVSPLREGSKSDLSAFASSLAADSDGGVANDPSKEVRVLNNAHVRRQIIRPWEDSGGSGSGSGKEVPPQSPPFAQHHSSIVKKQPLHNGSLNSSTPLSSWAKNGNLEHDDHIGVRGKDFSTRATSNSVQEAAEALMEIGQIAPSSDSQVESVDIEMTRSTLSMNSLRDDIPCFISSGRDPPADTQPPRQKEVVIDRKKQLSLFNHVTKATSCATIEQMDRLHSTFEHIVFRHRMSLDKRQLIEDLELATTLFFQAFSTTPVTSGSEH